MLQPLNERAATIITEHIDLLESNKVEPHLLQLVSRADSQPCAAHHCNIIHAVEPWYRLGNSSYQHVPD